MDPSPPTVVDWLTKAGPYAISLMLMLWLIGERRERLAAQKDATDLRERMIKERGESTKAMAEYGSEVETALREHDTRIDALLEAKGGK